MAFRPFNFDQQINYQPLNPKVIEGASKSPFSIAGEAMTDLNNAIDNRAFSKDIQSANSLEDLLGYNAKTKEQQAMLANRGNLLSGIAKQKVLDEEALRTQNLYQQREDAFTALGQDEKSIADRRLFQQNIKGLPSLQQQDPSITTGEFTALSPEPLSVQDKVGKEMLVHGGKSPTLELLKERNSLLTIGGKRKPTSFEEKDRWFREYQTLKNMPNRTSGQEERMSFLNDGITAFNYGVTENKQLRAESEMAQDFATTTSFIENKDYLSNPSKVTKTDYGRMDAIENRNMSNKENPSVKATQEKIDGMSGNHKTINELQNVFNMEASGDFSKVNKGLYGNLAQGLSKMTTGDLQTDEMLESMRQQINLDTRVGLIQAEFIKAISGATVSDTERAILLQGVTGGTFPTMDAMMTNLKAFQSTLIERNDLYAGQIFDVAPKSATKYRRYKNYEKKENKTPKKSVTIVDYSTAFR